MFDLHIHTIYSLDGKEKPEDILKYLKKKGFRGLAIVDHNTIKGALKVIKRKDMVVIPGMEINTRKGHILAFGIMEEIKSREADEAIDEIHDKGGIAILAHPFRFSKPCIKADAFEALNGRCFPMQNKKAYEYVLKNNFAYTAGSDGHYLWEMGRIYTKMEAEDIDEAINEILKKRVEIGGENSFLHPIKCKFYSSIDFIRRGFKRVR